MHLFNFMLNGEKKIHILCILCIKQALKKEHKAMILV